MEKETDQEVERKDIYTNLEMYGGDIRQQSLECLWEALAFGYTVEPLPAMTENDGRRGFVLYKPVNGVLERGYVVWLDHLVGDEKEKDGSS